MLLAGVDEVGRGCWAGPLVAGVVIMPENFRSEDGPLKLRDSKKMSQKQRDSAATFIHEYALAVGLGWVWPEELDISGITLAVKMAMERALAEITTPYDELIIDGNFNFFPDNTKAKAIIKADDIVPAVSAASIVAKVARDNYMHEISLKYPVYGFEKHVGYGTALHLAALKEFGICELHRTSYKPIKKIMEQFA
ncbi:MAG: ribonuclease HII [Candidatus Saccharimonadales bacterium]